MEREPKRLCTRDEKFSDETNSNDFQSTTVNEIKSLWQHVHALEEIIKKSTSPPALQKDEIPYQIDFNVGGKLFSLSRETLGKYPDTYFTALLNSTKWSTAQQGKPFFIDRNPKYFKIIADYLRTDALDTERLSPKQVEQLRVELDYYQLLSSVNPSLLPHLQWDPTYASPNYYLSNNNRKINILQSNSSSSDDEYGDDDGGPVQAVAICTMPKVFTFRLKISYDLEDMSESGYLRVGFIERKRLLSPIIYGRAQFPINWEEQLGWYLETEGNYYEFFLKRKRDKKTISQDEKFEADRIITVSYTPRENIIKFKMTDAKKGYKFRDVPAGLDLCPFVMMTDDFSVEFCD